MEKRLDIYPESTILGLGMMIMTMDEARTAGLDVCFFPTEAARTEYLAAFEDATGRATGTFEEYVLGFRLICGTMAPRPRPVITVMEA